MKTIHVGDLKDRLTLLYLERSSDQWGGWKEEWQRGPKIWAFVSPLQSREQPNALDPGGGLTSHTEYLKPYLTSRYRVVMRSDCPLKTRSHLLWHHPNGDQLLIPTCAPFLVLDNQFLCMTAVVKKEATLDA